MHYLLKGLYLITDEKLIERARFSETVELAVSGGANLLQLREKNTEHREIIHLGRKLLEITRKFNIPLIINDSPEIALEIGADGVHLGEDDPDIRYARELLGNDAIIGVSCYNRIERGVDAVEEGASYLAFGTPYGTPTKPGREPTSFETLKEARSRFHDIPIFAIGGIYPENAHEVLQTGIDGIAVITSVFGSDQPESSSRRLSALFQ